MDGSSMAKRKRKQVYSITLYEEVADRLRQLGGTLSGGIGRAQELLEADGSLQAAIEKRLTEEFGDQLANMPRSPAALPAPRVGGVPRQDEAGTDYDAVFGDTPAQASAAHTTRRATQDCWRCAAPVPVDHSGPCPICDANAPHGEPTDVEREHMNAGMPVINAHLQYGGAAEVQHEAQGSAFVPPPASGVALVVSAFAGLPAYSGTLAEDTAQRRSIPAVADEAVPFESLTPAERIDVALRIAQAQDRHRLEASSAPAQDIGEPNESGAAESAEPRHSDASKPDISEPSF